MVRQMICEHVCIYTLGVQKVKFLRTHIIVLWPVEKHVMKLP